MGDGRCGFYCEPEVGAPILPEIRGGVKWKMWFCRTPAMSILAVSYSIAIFPLDTLRTGLFGDRVIALREMPAGRKT